MEYNALDVEDYALGQAMAGYVPGGVSAFSVGSFPDSVPSGTVERFENGWSASSFTDALKGVSSSFSDVAKTIYGIENTANAMSLERLRTATALDVAKTQAGTARDIALAESRTQSARAQMAMAQAEQAAKLNRQLTATSGNDFVLLALLGVGAWMLAKRAAA